MFYKWIEERDKGNEPPAKFYQLLDEQPEIAEHLYVYWDAFSDLGTERQIGMGIGPIPRSKVREYASDLLGLDGDEHDRFCEILSRMDRDYVSRVNSPRSEDGPNFREIVDPKDGERVKKLAHRMAKPRKRNG